MNSVWKNIINKQELRLIEDHHEVYYIWKKRKLFNLPLIHIDAHLDLSTDYLKNKKIQINNFIYPALIDGVIGDLYWIIPNSIKVFNKSLLKIKNILSTLRKYDKEILNRMILKEGFLKTKLLKRNFIICTLDSLPKLNKPVLLDIDLDFLIISSIEKASNRAEISKRKQWITIKKFVDKIKNNITNPKFITIAYSVNGGWTPMVYKTLGEQIIKELGFNHEEVTKKIAAGELFAKFRHAFDRNQIPIAKKYYENALRLNPLYDNLYNNFGLLYLLDNDVLSAKKEFIKMLQIDSHNSNYMYGLAMVYMTQGDLLNSKKLLQKVNRSKKMQKEIGIYLAYLEFKLGNDQKAKKLLRQCIKNKQYVAFSNYLLSQIAGANSKIEVIQYRRNQTLETPFWLRQFI